MKFERLRLAGFKTFVEPTELVIAPGLTGVVGPNGCGKSNLVEALRWVMGETSSKSLRGGGMDDVIFGGSATRPERNHAEVSIRISEPPTDMLAHLTGADHIEIARKIVREQGSTYRMNGREVRARDVQILFADAASGARSPSMVRQGQIGEIIAAKPQHRRRILEDAAGIAGLHARRHEAELRLKQAEDNLTRAEDVLGQLDRQIGDLKKQARQSERYKAIAAEIRQLELVLLAAGLVQAETEAKAARTEHDRAVRTIATAMTVQGESERVRAISEHELDQARRAASEAASALQRQQLARETLDNEMRLADQRLKDIAARRAEALRDAEAAREVLADAEQSVARLAAEDRGIADQLAADRAGSSGDATAAADAETARVEAEIALNAAQTEMAERTAMRRAAEARVRETEARLERLARGLQEAERDLGAIEADGEALERLRAVEASVEARATEYEAALATAAAAEQAAHDARSEEQAARPKFGEADRLLQRLETEARTIRKIVENSEPGLWTPVVDLISVEPGFETALAAALGEDLEAASEAGASRHWGGGGAFGEAPALPAGVTSVLAHVTAPVSLHRRLSQIGLVARENGSSAQKQLRQGQRLVSREGDLWRWDGFTAAAEAPSSAARRLAERNRLAEIETQIEEARARREVARKAFDAAQIALRKTQDTEAQSRDAVRRAAQARDTANAELQREMRRSEEARLRLEAARNRATSLKSDLDEARALADTAREALAEIAEAGDATARLSELSAALAEARRQESACHLAQSRRTERIVSLETRRQAIAREGEAWRDRAAKAQHAQEHLDERLATLDDQAKQLEGLPAEIASRKRQIERMIEAAEATARAASDALAQGESRQRAADEAARDAFRRLSEAREGAARLDALAEGAEARLVQLRQTIEERIEAPVSDLAARIAEDGEVRMTDPAAIEARLVDLRQDRDRMGAVNLRADVELVEIEKERGDLAREREDITEAIRKFRRAIDTLNSEGRGRLRAAFATVNEHFGTLFQRLFGGGSAELQLVEADDPLEAGLEILAKPPGKKPQLLSLLSGGEQALTATALIFAVFLTNPAPICVLDEVDAPLDDSNVERLCDLLTDMAQETQTRFLMITHNPISMARMDRLFGVTMIERGISQLVSVDLATAERLAEAV
ncbi:MAG TPA: AAA family ATPase [Rhabdaerophilum sp.]|nr:AAA family ATPase [Rhabdaerophilum sp.]